MEAINKLEYLVDRYLTDKITKDEFPMVWAYCQVPSEKYRLKNAIVERMVHMVNPDIDAVITMIESELFNISE
ncbi:MAG: hypothetical protein HC892_01665 [Saprospiraceae bacterium]|nr:hypothetical protein [Saprospiraceae bacterium]